MANISQLTTANTFGNWLTQTQALITTINTLVEGGGGTIFYSNTNIALANNLTIGGDLTVTGNIVMDSIGFNDSNVSGNLIVTGNTTTGNLTVTGNVVISTSVAITKNISIGANTTINIGNHQMANVTQLVGSANTAIYANITSSSAGAAADGLAFAIALG